MARKINVAELREKIAEAEHNQWWKWAQNISEQEKIGLERQKRWRDYFVPYNQLTEEVKELDRKQADIIIKVLKEYDLL